MRPRYSARGLQWTAPQGTSTASGFPAAPIRGIMGHAQPPAEDHRRRNALPGVRGVLVYCADFHCTHSIAISTDTSGSPILNHASCVRPAASEAPMCGRISIGRGSPPRRWAIVSALVRSPQRPRDRAF